VPNKPKAEAPPAEEPAEEPVDEAAEEPTGEHRDALEQYVAQVKALKAEAELHRIEAMGLKAERDHMLKVIELHKKRQALSSGRITLPGWKGGQYTSRSHRSLKAAPLESDRTRDYDQHHVEKFREARQEVLRALMAVQLAVLDSDQAVAHYKVAEQQRAAATTNVGKMVAEGTLQNCNARLQETKEALQKKKEDAQAAKQLVADFLQVWPRLVQNPDQGPTKGFKLHI